MERLAPGTLSLFFAQSSFVFVDLAAAWLTTLLFFLFLTGGKGLAIEQALRK